MSTATRATRATRASAAAATRASADAARTAAVRTLLARSEAELAASHVCADPSEEFRHAHLGAIRAAAALIESEGPASRRHAPRNVWDMLRLADPDLAGWAVYFADSARLRAAVDAGRADVSAERASLTRVAAEDFLDTVRARLGVDVVVQPTLQAS